jgi:hypothetical protein
VQQDFDAEVEANVLILSAKTCPDNLEVPFAGLLF